ncbi:MAG: helix-turn-helix domain-containing protein [Thioalkalivibrio sp.]|nr:MAG: helix-turn-helix domain-containing protein [Thioalkalivibrio sp.]
MALRASAWAWSLDLPTTPKLVLLALAEHADDKGVCWPSQERIARMCGLSVRHLRRVCSELATRGLIGIEHRPGAGNGRQTDLYRLSLGSTGQPDIGSPQGDAMAAWATGHPEQATGHPGQGNRTPGGGQPDTDVRQTVMEPSREPSMEPPTASDVEPVSRVKSSESLLRHRQQEGFGRFWEAWPKRVAKGDAQKAWAKLDPDDALTGRIVEAVHAARQCEQWRRDGGRFVPYPATWLRRQGWEDEHRVRVEHLPDRGPCRPTRFDGTLNALNELFGGNHGETDLPEGNRVHGRGLRHRPEPRAPGRVLGPDRRNAG